MNDREAREAAAKALSPNPARWQEFQSAVNVVIDAYNAKLREGLKSQARVTTRGLDSDCAGGFCLGDCSHLMWECRVCSSEGGWGAPREKLERMAAEHVCAVPSARERQGVGDKQLLAVFQEHYVVPEDDEWYDPESLLRGLRAVAALSAQRQDHTEPEWEYGAVSRTNWAENGQKSRPFQSANPEKDRALGYLIVRRRPAGPWLLVEGKSDE